MIQVRSFALLSLALAVGLPAAAQSADVSSGPSTTPTILFDNGNGATKAAFMYSNGGTNAQPGGCAGGMFSEIEAGVTLFGAGNQVSAGNSVADDFVVPAGEAWDLTSLNWLGYQTNAATTGTFTQVVVNVVPGNDPNGAPLAGGGAQSFSMAFSGVYRTAAGTPTNCARALQDLTVDMTWVPVLAPGQYWITVACDGSAASGPWAPPTVPWLPTDNGQQSVTSGPFAPMITGQGGGSIDFPFSLSGDDGTGGGVTSFCAQTKVTSVAGCTASLTVADTSLATGTWDTTNIPRSINLAPGSTVGIYIFTNGVGIGQDPGILNTVFGAICLTNFTRSTAGCPAATAITQPGVCNTSLLSLSPNCNGGALGIAVGEDVNCQAWYRDGGAGIPGDANLSNAVWYTVQ